MVIGRFIVSVIENYVLLLGDLMVLSVFWCVFRIEW